MFLLEAPEAIRFVEIKGTVRPVFRGTPVPP
jgi:hypothetical protein